MSEVVWLIKYDELGDLLNLYKQLLPDDPDVYEDSALKNTWDLIFHDSNLYYIVVEVGGRIVSSCNISIIKNLTRNLRMFILNNGVTVKNR